MNNSYIWRKKWESNESVGVPAYLKIKSIKTVEVAEKNDLRNVN